MSRASDLADTISTVISARLDRFCSALLTPSGCIVCQGKPTAYLEGFFGHRHGLCALHATEARGKGMHPHDWPAQEQQT